MNLFAFSARSYTSKSNVIIVDGSKLDGDLANYPISDNTRRCLEKRGITTLFPVQSATYKDIIEGHDVITRAHTGTGKTLSFVIPIVEKLLQEPTQSLQRRKPRVLVLEPTRELAIQTAREFSSIASLFRTQTVYGGASIELQSRGLQRGADIVVGTPGRMVDMGDRGDLDLSEVEYVVLDEADAMLQAGFQTELNAILGALKGNPQYLLFSATIPSWVSQVAKKYLKADHKLIDLVADTSSRTATQIKHYAIPCTKENRADALADILRYYSKGGSSIVFTDTKLEASEIGASTSMGPISQVLHGDITQRQREITLRALRDRRFKCLVATDVAARGIDLPDVEVVIQLQVPQSTESYIHRSGRTGRAGKAGVSVLLYDVRDVQEVKDLERQVGIKFERTTVPQPEEVLNSTAKSLAEVVKSVPQRAASRFEESAKSLAEELGPLEALSAALAKLSNRTESATRRSILSGALGFETLKLSPRSPFFSIRRAKTTLADLTANFGSVAISVDGELLFEIPEGEVDSMLEEKSDDWTISRCTELPELNPGPSREGFRGGSRGGFRGSSRGGSRGGFRNERPAFGGRDSFRGRGDRGGERRGYEGNSERRPFWENRTSSRSNPRWEAYGAN